MRVEGRRVYHFVARIHHPGVNLCGFDVGQWLWERLRNAFPRVLGGCLMPDHLHGLSPLDDPEAARQRLNRILGHLARRLDLPSLGQAPMPTLVADREKALRDLRYIGLNAVRDGLVTDPLSWLFSTHRDIVGATVDPWIDADRLASVVRKPKTGFAAWYHGYVSADPDVDVNGTPPPFPSTSTDVPIVPLANIARAVAAATRTRPNAIRQSGLTRNLFVWAAFDQGWTHRPQLASACACSPRTIRHIATRPPEPLDAVRLCLGDARLLESAPRWTTPSPPGIRSNTPTRAPRLVARDK